jgi:hypothetical protein
MAIDTSAVLLELRRLQSVVEAQQLTIAALERRVMNLEESEAQCRLSRRNTNDTFQRTFAPSFDDRRTAQLQPARASSPPSGPLLKLDPNTALDTHVGGDSSDNENGAADMNALHDLVARCALDFLNMRATDSSGVWCEDCDGPCRSAHYGPPELERAPDACPSRAVSVTVNGTAVPVTELFTNSAVEYLLQHPAKSGRWCEGHGDRDIARCTFIHRKSDGADGAPRPTAATMDTGRPARDAAPRIMVEGTPIPLTALERNKAVELLLTHPTRDGQWCEHDEATHDVTVCYRVHKRRAAGDHPPASRQGSGTGRRIIGNAAETSDNDGSSAEEGPSTECVLVSGKSVPVTDLRRNPAVDYLIRNPTKRGRWCAANRDHNPDDCQFVHRKTPDAIENADTKVNVAGDWVPVTDLAPNRAVDYLLQHPNRRGRWCSGHGKKTVQECTFIHTRCDNPTHGEEGPCSTCCCTEEGGARPPLSNGNAAMQSTAAQRTTRMVVYYEQDDDHDEQR